MSSKKELRPERERLANKLVAAWNNLNNHDPEYAAELFDEVSELAAEQAEEIREEYEIDG